MDNHKKNIDGREFVRLLTANQRKIFSYILALVPNFNDADDIMQETTSLMWERMGDFTSGTDFVAWGNRIAYFKILDYRKKFRRQRKIVLNDEIFEQMAKDSTIQSSKTDDALSRLRDCLKKLQRQDKQLLHLRFSVNLSVKQISARLNNSIRNIYYNLSRIQGVLMNCIERNS